MNILRIVYTKKRLSLKYKNKEVYKLNINFGLPTKIVMGKDCVQSNGDLFSSFGKRAMLVTGRNSAKLNGSQADVIKVLEARDIAYVVYDEVQSNPSIDCVRMGAIFAKKEKVDFIIAIGGGSPIDAGKAIAILAKNDITDDELFNAGYSNNLLPVIAIPTTAGTGTEVTQYSILTNDKAKTKTGIASPYIFPKVAVLDAKYMTTLSKVVTVNTAIDALSHSIEGMLSIKANVMTNLIAKESIKNIVGCFENLVSGDIDYVVREKLLYASMLGGIVIAHTGTTAVHSMGYSLTYFKHIDHGRANGILLGDFLKLVNKEKPDVVNDILGTMDFKDIDEFKEIITKLLGEKEDISAEEFKAYSQIAIKAKNIANCSVVPTEKDLYDIYMSSFK